MSTRVSVQQPLPAGGDGRLHAVLTAGLLRQHNEETAAEYRHGVERKDDEWTWETKSSSKFSVYSKESLVSVGTDAFEETLLAHVQGAADIGAKKKRAKRGKVKRQASKAKSKVVKKVSQAKAKAKAMLGIRAAKKKQQKLAKEYAGDVKALLQQVNVIQDQVEEDVRDQRDYATLVLAWVDDRGKNNRAERKKYKSEWKKNVKKYDIEKYGEEMWAQMLRWGNKMKTGKGVSDEETSFINAWMDLQKAVVALHKYNNDTYLPEQPKLAYSKAPGTEGWEAASKKEADAATARANEAYDAIKAAVDKLRSDEEWATINAALASYWKKTNKPKGLVERLL